VSPSATHSCASATPPSISTVSHSPGHPSVQTEIETEIETISTTGVEETAAAAAAAQVENDSAKTLDLASLSTLWTPTLQHYRHSSCLLSPPFCLSIYLSICLSVYLSIYLSVCPSICLSVLFVCLSVCLSIYLSV
jgi:hypothetical protein